MVEYASATETSLVRAVDDVMQWADSEFAHDLIHRLEAHMSFIYPPIDYASASNSLRIRRGGPVAQQTYPYNPSSQPRSQLVIDCLIKQCTCLYEYSDHINNSSSICSMLAILNLMVS